jgi:hypothetical protein
MGRSACCPFLLVAAALGARAESMTSTSFDGAEAPWARASRQFFLGATSPPPPSLGTDACVFTSEADGDDCDDDDGGAPGSDFPMCAYCTSCVDCCPRVPRAPTPPPAGTPSGTGSPDAKYLNGQLGPEGADYGPGQSLPSPAVSPAPSRAGTGICTKTCFYDAECDDGCPVSKFPICAYDNGCVDCDGRTASPPPPPHSPGMICTNNCHNAGGSSCNEGGGPGSECLFCATRAVVSFKSAIVGTNRALASIYRAVMGTSRVVMGNMRVLVSCSSASMDTVGTLRGVVGRIRAVASTTTSTTRAVVVTIHDVKGNMRAVVSVPRAVVSMERAVVITDMRAVVSIPRAVIGTIRAVVGPNCAVTSTNHAVASTSHAVGSTSAVLSTFRAERTLCRHEHPPRRREHKPRRREPFTSPAPSAPPPKTPPCRSDSGHDVGMVPERTMAPDLAHVLDVVRAVHVQPWQLGASLDDREGVEVDANRLGVWLPLDAACAAQDARCGGERSKEGLLVLCFGVLDKGCPMDRSKPLVHAARVPGSGLAPACLSVGPPSCQRVASTGFSVESAHHLYGGSILNPRQLVCWGCLLMASLMAWHRRFAESPCSQPHRPRGKQGVHGALTLLAWCTMLPCTETSDVPGLNRGLQLALPRHRRELQNTNTVFNPADLISALADTTVSRIVLAPGTYNLIAELRITRSVILEAATGATVTLNAPVAPVLSINPGWSGVVVQLIGLGITGAYSQVRAHVQKFPSPPWEPC